MTEYQGIIGLIGLIAIAWLISEQRRSLRLKVPLAGLALQFLIAALMLKLPQSRSAFAIMNEAVLALQAATEAGTSFVFGYLGGGPLPFEETAAGD